MNCLLRLKKNAIKFLFLFVVYDVSAYEISPSLHASSSIIISNFGRNNSQNVQIGKDISVENKNEKGGYSGYSLVISSNDISKAQKSKKCSPKNVSAYQNCENSSFNQTNLTYFIIGVSLNSSEFSNLRIEKSNFSDVTFRRANFLNSDIIDTIFLNSSFEQAKFSNSKISGSKFENPDFSNAILRNVVFDDVSFIKPNFTGTSLINVDFSKSNIDLLDIEEAKLVNVKLPNGVTCLSNTDCN